jgi:hypothetical protein
LRSRSGGTKNGNHVQPVEEVLAKVAARDLLFQVFIGRGDHPHIDLHRTGRANRREAAFIQRAQHFGLHLEAHVADFIEEERAAVGALEGAAFLRSLACGPRRGDSQRARSR